MANPNPKDANPAADIIRQKLQQVYAEEPAAKEELAEVKSIQHRSKHQKFVYELSRSGRSLVEIQTAWHNYYTQLPDREKHEVWQEFYEEHNRRRSLPKTVSRTPLDLPETKSGPHEYAQSASTKRSQRHNNENLKHHLLSRVQSQTNRSKGHRGHSLLFGLACGFIVVIIFLFSFFNERFVAPFITPSKVISNSAIIIDPNSTNAGPESIIIIPKINVEIPVIYNEPSIDEAAVQRALQDGVLHYPTTSNPGELGNGAIFGHSSNNIFNSGKYKFAFVLLKRLESGDTFILQKNGKRFVYKVYDKRIVSPDDLSVLGAQPGKKATFSLITCDPPGTSINRLVVTGEQITPDPLRNVASSAKTSGPQPAILPSNAPTLWQRFKDWITS